MIARAVPLRSSMASRRAVVQSHGNATTQGGRRDRGRSRTARSRPSLCSLVGGRFQAVGALRPGGA
jgi:hypothetical protein